MENRVTYYNEKGLKRFINAFIFSFAGFKAAWTSEEAFRQEVIVFIIAVPLSIWLGQNNLEIVLLMATVGLVLIVELLNSAIEAVVDRVGVEYHELAGRAKDLGSAAVMSSILLAVVTWLLILFY
jgi:diacylglycerol kinase (ATP)